MGKMGKITQTRIRNDFQRTGQLILMKKREIND
jgi:hypothetical protein